jgi:hypothetical protein
MLDSFNKGIKRDKSNYPTLKFEKNWKQWFEDFKIQMHADDLSELLDPNYQPGIHYVTRKKETQGLYARRALYSPLAINFADVAGTSVTCIIRSGTTS